MSNQLAEQGTTLAEYLRSPNALQKFIDVLGNERGAKQYVQSVLIAVANSNDLQECTNSSVLSCALRSASLELSCDPALRQAQLVPFENRKTGRKEATLIVHYIGLGVLVQRTGKYRIFEVNPMYKGYIVEKDLVTGIHSVTLDPKEFDPNVKIGYLGYFETLRGFKKTVYMTIEEIHEHAKKFSRGYNSPKSLWKDPNHVETMEKKTVFRALAKWADLSGVEQAFSDQFFSDEIDEPDCNSDDEYIDSQFSEEQALADIGFAPVDSGEKPRHQDPPKTGAGKPAATQETPGDFDKYTYEDGSTVQAGDSAKAQAERKSFDEYTAAHDGKVPANVFNLRSWVKKVKSEN